MQLFLKKNGLKVIGVYINKSVINTVNQGISPINELD